MRKSLFFSVLMGGGLGCLAFGANAMPIHVNLAGAAGSQSWTSPVIGDPHGTLTLTGWELDNGVWTPAAMTYKNPSPDETGLGVACNQKPIHNSCSQDEIGTTPWQMIDLNISALTGWGSLTINLASVNGIGYPGGDETAYLLGADCMVGGSCTPTVLASTPLASCTNFAEICSFNFTEADLVGITNIWVTPSLTDQSGKNNGNILLGADFVLYTAVPEPATLGIFGLGILMIGMLVGLRRLRR
ncbi:MAG: PEP-CTERM sorting domain-containing protein [Gammaproteobacteria bacterium]|nr:PEP-CTERM sorting domain-containing protein [Gammaproteobacteria bacterium]